MTKQKKELEGKQAKDKKEYIVDENNYSEIERYQNKTLQWMEESLKSPLAMKTIK